MGDTGAEEGGAELSLQRELLFLLLHSLRAGPASEAAAALEAEAARLQLLPSFFSPFGARAADGSLPTHPQTYTQVRLHVCCTWAQRCAACSRGCVVRGSASLVAFASRSDTPPATSP